MILYKSKFKESESIIDQINTPEFKKWFGKSKVVDSSGKPLIVYHGSKDKFDTFDYSKMSWQTIQSQQGSGFYFTDNKRQASAYGKTGEFYLSIENPLILKYHSKNISFDQAMEIYGSGDNDWFFTDYLAFQLSKEKGEFPKEELLAEWIKKGMNYENDIFVVQNMKRAYKESSYGKMMKLFMSITKFDGLIQEVSGGLKVYVAYKPNQIKSATRNNRDFSLQSDNIYESHFKESKEIYYHGDKDVFDIDKPYSFYTKDKAYAMKFSRQYNTPKIYTVELSSSANIYPEPIWYKDWENILKWNPKHDPRFKGYDVVPIIEPNGEDGSIVVLNPKVLKLIKVEDGERVEW